MATDQVSSAISQIEIDPATNVFVTSSIIQVEIFTAPPPTKYTTQDVVEVLSTPDNGDINVSEDVVEVLSFPDTAQERVTEFLLEVLIPSSTTKTLSTLDVAVEYENESILTLSTLSVQVEEVPTQRYLSTGGVEVEYSILAEEQTLSTVGVLVEYTTEIELSTVLFKKYMLSVADVYGYDLETGDLLFVGKTLLDSSIDISTDMIDTYSGRGESLSNIYFDSTEVTIEISEVQFSLNIISATTGSSLNTGQNIYEEESVVLGLGGVGSVSKTPVSTIDGVNIYGWVTLTDGSVEKVTFSGNNFSCSGSKDDCVNIRYYTYSSATRTIDISSEIVPTELRLVLETQLSMSDMFFTNNITGLTQIIIPKAILSGTFNFSLTPDGVSSTPLTARAIATVPEGTSGVQDMIYAQIIETSESLYWYSDIIALSIVGGDFSMTVSDNKRLDVRAIPSSGSAFKPQYEDIIFSSSNDTVASVSTSGIITANSAGTATIKATIRQKQLIDANIVVTVS